MSNAYLGGLSARAVLRLKRANAILTRMKVIESVLLAMASAQAALPPPMVIYDPNPGPFVVFVGDSGELEEKATAILKNAVESWSADRDKRLGAFLLCFRQADASPSSAHMQRKALSLTAESLIAAGASVVTVGTSSICNSIPRVMIAIPVSQHPTVEVRGVLLADDR